MCPVGRALRRIGAGVLLCLLALPVGVSGAPEGQRAELTLKVDTVDRGDVEVVLRGKDVLVGITDLKAAGLAHIGAAPEHLYGRDFVSLDALAPAVKYVLNADSLELALTVDPADLSTHARISLDTLPFAKRFTSARSLFLNYAFSGGSTGFGFSGELGASIGKRFFKGYFSRLPGGGLFLGPASITTDELGRYARMEVGDFVASSGTLGGSEMLAGIHIRRDFALDPAIIRTSSSSVAGEVSTPTEADVYINGLLVRREQLAPGQFELNDLPVQNGVNAEQIVLRDAFGYERVINGSFYGTTTLLGKGLSDYDFGFGVPERLGGVGTPGRNGATLVAQYERGMTNNLTLGARLEKVSGLLSAGISLSASSSFGQFSYTQAVSRDGLQRGSASDFIYNYVNRRLGVALERETESPQYETLNQFAASDRVISSATANVTYRVSRSSDLFLSYQSQHDRDSAPMMTFSLGMAQDLRGLGSLSLAFGRETFLGQSKPVLNLTYSAALGRDLMFNAQSQEIDGQRATSIDVAHDPISESGLAYRADVSQSSGTTQSSVSAAYREQYGIAQINVEGTGEQRTAELSYAGSVVFTGDTLALAQPVDRAYAIVDTGVSGVDVYANGRYVGRTHGDGKIVAVGLEPYLPNQIAIDPNTAPEDVMIDKPSVTIAPREDSGQTVTLQVHRFQGFSGKLIVLTPHGIPKVPAYGELVLHARRDVTSDIGEDGAFFLENPPVGTYPAEIAYKGGDCRFHMTVPATKATYVKLGTLQCTEK